MPPQRALQPAGPLPRNNCTPLKILHLLRALCCLAFVALAQTRGGEAKPPSIVGTWSGKDETGSIGSFVFEADGSADLLTDGVSMKASLPKGEGSITYRLDPSTKPVSLDIIFARNGQPVMTLQCIVEFLSPDKMRVRRPMGRSRPTDFSGPPNEIIVVQRVESGKK